VITDPSTGVIQFVNPAFERITGYGREESLGRTLHFLESGEHDEEYFRGVREALKHSGVWSGRLLNRKKDGTVYHEECAISIVRDASGAVANYVYVKRDVTEKARLEKIAESLKTMETIGYVFSGLRNEIGNPINALNMIIGVLRTRLGSLAPESVRQYVDRMAGQIDRVEHLLRRMRNFSLFETHRPRSIPLEEFLESFLALVREDFVSAGIALEVSRASEAQRVFADPWALQQILLNILNNARDALAGRPDPLIRLDVTKERGRIRFSIRDNGSGMTDTVRKSLFQPFFTTKENGMGLGLVIVKKLLAHMRGDIAVAGEAGAGTTVDITVPEEEG
jgi:PAS domain S-box-containing protein